MQFMCLVHLEPADLEGLSEDDGRRLTDLTIEQDHALHRRGKLIYGRPLEPPQNAVTVRVRNGKVRRMDGPFAEAREWVGGFLLIEADDRDEAVAIASECEIARYGRIEVRALVENRHSVTGQARPAMKA